jgi:hypothetical protein
MVEEQMLPASSHMSKRLANKETTCRKAKEKIAWKKCKRANGYLKTMQNQKDSTICSTHPSLLPLQGGEDYLKVSQAIATAE